MSSISDSRIGTELAGYRIETALGRGGMGVVYRAHDLALERAVALKLISPALAADRDFRRRFLVESRLAAALDHPYVVPIYDAGEAEGQLYLAMRYVEGSDLKRLLQAEGTLDSARAIAVCAQLADALDGAHAGGLVHRDVKPSNVLLDEQGHAYLADFGLTRRLTELAPGFETGLSLGTPAYVAPEQIEGKEVDGRADQYSLACLLHECLTGKPPFPRTSEAAVLFAHLEEQPPTPAGLEHVLPRALAMDPDKRYESCAAFVADARSALGLEPRRPRWPLALAGLGAALIGAALLAFFLTRGDGAAPLAGPAGRLFRIDPATNQVASTIRVGQNPNAVAVAGDGSVWVASRDDATVWKVDPDRNRTDLSVSAHGKPADLAAAGGQVFVSNSSEDASVVVINAATGREEDVVRLGTLGFVPVGSALVAVGEAGLWVADGDRNVGRLDPTLSRLEHPVLLPAPPDEQADAFLSAIAVSRDAIWVVGDAEAPLLWRVDPAGGDAETIPLDSAPKDVAVGEGAVWVTSQLDDTVSRIDPATHDVTATVGVGRGAAGIAVGAGSVWVANAIDGTVSRIDPATARVTKTIEVAGSAEDVVVGGGAVWVTGHERANASAKRADDAVRIGVLTDCEGVFAREADMSIAGAELPLLRRGAKLAGPLPASGVVNATVADKPVALVLGCSDGTAEGALSEARRLVEQAGVDVLIGPTTTPESFAIKEYARRQPGATFVDGTSSVPFRQPAENLFRFSTDVAQWMAGAGAYAYNELDWRDVVIVGDLESSQFIQAAGFLAEFCALGGTVSKRIWVPLTTQDYAPYIKQVPRRAIDGFVLLGSPSTLAFANGVPALQGKLARKVVLGYWSFGLPLDARFTGVVRPQPYPALFAAKPPSWTAYTAAYDRAFPMLAGIISRNVFAVLYYGATDAVLTALEEVGGDLSGGQRRFRDALASLELQAPQGKIRLDENRRAVGPNYLVKLAGAAKGQPGAIPDPRVKIWEAFRSVPDVEPTFGGYFKPSDPLPSSTAPACVKRTPAPWAHH